MAYSFNGTNQYFNIAVAPASGSPMTMAALVRPTSMTGTRTVMAVGQVPATVRHRNQIVMPSTGIVRATAAGSTNAFADTAGAATVNTWCHVAGVFASTSSRIAYFNGQASTENTASITQSTFTETVVAAQQGNASGVYENPWTGDIAEVGIWSVTLNADEIAALSKGVSPALVRPQSLAFYAPLIRDIVDVRGGVTITNTNTATVANHPRVYA